MARHRAILAFLFLFLAAAVLRGGEPPIAEPPKPLPAEPAASKALPSEPAEPAKGEPAKAEPAKAEPAKAEPAKTEPAKVEPAGTDPAKAEPANKEPAKAEPPKKEDSEDEYELQRALVDALDQVERNYVKPIDRRELIEAAIEGVMRKLDPYSSYIGPKELDVFRTSVESEFGGIGIQVSVEEGQLVVLSPLVGTPAYEAGILAGDAILEIDGRSTDDLDLDEAVRRMKGPTGSKVVLTILHVHEDEPRKVELVRRQIHVETVLGGRLGRLGPLELLLQPPRVVLLAEHLDIAALEAGKRVALANKESLVMGGPLITRLAQRNGAKILPVDSEHSAVFQALSAGSREEVRRVVLTASGGPFRTYTNEQLAAVTVQDALAHPTWAMGPKITVDSATLMNKALEVIEARWLFDLEPDQIGVVLHPQSIVHSMVEYLSLIHI